MFISDKFEKNLIKNYIGSMDRKLKIVCDCDNVLLNFSESFAEWHNGKYDDITVQGDPDDYDFGVPDHSELVWERINEFWMSPEMAKVKYMEPEINVKFKELRALHDVVVYSAVDNQCKELRMANLKDFDLEDSEVVLRVDKLVPIIDDVKPDICIDDAPENIEELTAAGIPVFYPRYVKYTSHVKSELAIPYENWDNLLELISILYSKL